MKIPRARTLRLVIGSSFLLWLAAASVAVFLSTQADAPRQGDTAAGGAAGGAWAPERTLPASVASGQVASAESMFPPEAPAALEAAPTPEPPPTPVAQAAASVDQPTAAPPPPAPPAPPPPTPALDAALASELLGLVNAERTARGLRSLTVDPRLTAAASSYALVALELDWHDHVGPDGRPFYQRLRDAGVTENVYLGEVMGWGWSGWGPRDILQSWLTSPTHEAQVLSPVFALGGVACAVQYESAGRRIHCVLDMAGQ